MQGQGSQRTRKEEEEPLLRSERAFCTWTQSYRGEPVSDEGIFGWNAAARYGASAPSGLARVTQPRRDAVYRGRDDAVDVGGIFALTLAAQHVDLDQMHGVDVGVAQLDGVGENLIGLKQLRLTQDGEQAAH